MHANAERALGKLQLAVALMSTIGWADMRSVGGTRVAMFSPVLLLKYARDWNRTHRSERSLGE